MTTQEPEQSETYDVVLLCEEALTALDAEQVTSLHQELRDEGQAIRYHVLLPVEDAAARVEAAMGSLAAGEVMAAPAMAISEVDLEEVRRDCEERSQAAVDESVRQLESIGATVTGHLVHGAPVDALTEAVSRLDGREAIILTRPHVVAEFFHVDWTSKARRKLGVPVLHLLEKETFGEQGESGV
ncbi:hypothetical protein [Nocardioides alcanivorans]|uniref:hypothetical protein n=1 Tax=Nocardioides alcanivorans TaxID=2897352 RepID=UPI001F336FAF|nr:hypothetical protein [Nocardioides alcanivorans]